LTSIDYFVFLLFQLLKDFKTTPLKNLERTPPPTPPRERAVVEESTPVLPKPRRPVPRPSSNTSVASSVQSSAEDEREGCSAGGGSSSLANGVSSMALVLDVNDNHDRPTAPVAAPALPKRAPTFNLPKGADGAGGGGGMVVPGDDGPSLPRVGAVQEGTLSLGEVIGCGQFGSVHAGRWRAPNGAEVRKTENQILYLNDLRK
jgi:hypothetical protein